MWFDSGRVCLDLLATHPPRGGPEQIRDGDELRLWLVGAGLVPDRTPLGLLGPDWVAAFRALRGDVDHLVRAELAGAGGGPGPGPVADARDALARLNEAAAGAPPGLCAVRDQEGHLVRELCGRVECAGLLSSVARDAVELLTDPGDLALLRTCAGEGCARVYLDTSRGHRRRWCSSERCGNRERVARHRRRTRRGVGAG
ncbi:CGNR zinc finger domain-containing protein [Streptomyces sp. NPDC048606]|uniref:CGNR zinc finger domain-containing protein n=1 Tax=Streptomyces sp. NPDC048606 TaxID=3154726 RepID=UPI003430A450